MAEKHIVRNWRGKRESYNFLKRTNHLDAWTRYSVIESGGSGNEITEYFGENLIAVPTGQILPVSAVVETLPSAETARPYDRYLVGSDSNGYQVYEFQPEAAVGGTRMVAVKLQDFDWRYGVRVRADGLKNYIYFDGKLITYDDVDCGTF